MYTMRTCRVSACVCLYINIHFSKLSCAVFAAWGQLSELYKEICDLERVQNKINPSAKAPYKEVTAKILEALIAFNNDMNAVKIFFKKSAAKSRAKKKASEIPKEEEE